MAISVEEFQSTSRAILSEVGKVIVGQDERLKIRATARPLCYRFTHAGQA